MQAALANTRGFTSATGEIDAERVAMLESALEVLGDGDSPERACLLAARAVELAFCGEPDTPHTLSQQALAMVRRTGDDAAPGAGSQDPVLRHLDARHVGDQAA